VTTTGVKKYKRKSYLHHNQH